MFIGDDILVYRRDNRPDIRFANMLDLPGGGRENGESGAQCVARETWEEFGIRIATDEFEHVGTYPNWRGEGLAALFFVCRLPPQTLEEIVFGEEGQGWETMPVKAFLKRDDAVSHLQLRLRDFLKN